MNLYSEWYDTLIQWGVDVQRTLGNGEVPTASLERPPLFPKSSSLPDEDHDEKGNGGWILLSGNAVEGTMPIMTLLLRTLRILMGRAKAAQVLPA